MKYVGLLLGSILFNYLLGRRIEACSGRPAAKAFLIGGISANLLLLGYFKYMNFFLEAVGNVVGVQWSIGRLVLPLGISFFTFTQIAYLVDAYRGETKGYSFLNYSWFVTFFPHLIVGPILYHKDIMPQFERLQTFLFSHRNVAQGLMLFGLGLFKKVVIADYLSRWVTPVFGRAQQATFIDAWVGALSYTLQLYFDFSGYSDMAIGLGLMFNIGLPLNFNSPYKATSIIEFWRRWHMTLAWFLKNYLYIPLGGNRHGEPRRMANIMITMLLGGLWHGAGWTFVFWGGLHGVCLVINHLWRKLNVALPGLVAWLLTFAAVVVGWVFFRARTFGDAITLVLTVAGFHGIELPTKFQNLHPALSDLGLRFTDSAILSHGEDHLLGLAILIGLVCTLPNTQEILRRLQPTWKWAALGAGALAYAMLSLHEVSEFLYFRF